MRAGGESSFPLSKGVEGETLDRMLGVTARDAFEAARLFAEHQGMKLKEKGLVRVVVSVEVAE